MNSLQANNFSPMGYGQPMTGKQNSAPSYGDQLFDPFGGMPHQVGPTGRMMPQGDPQTMFKQMTVEQKMRHSQEAHEQKMEQNHQLFRQKIGQSPQASQTYQPQGIPQYALGVWDAPGGPAIVGENGPELIQVPKGSNIYPNNVLKSLSTGGSGAVPGSVSGTMPVGGSPYNYQPLMSAQMQAQPSGVPSSYPNAKRDQWSGGGYVQQGGDFGRLHGFDANNFNNPDMQTAKYQAGRLMSRYAPSTSGLQSLFQDPEFQQNFPGAKIVGDDKIDFGDGRPVDVLEGWQNGNANAWQWLTADSPTNSYQNPSRVAPSQSIYQTAQSALQPSQSLTNDSDQYLQQLMSFLANQQITPQEFA